MLIQLTGGCRHEIFLDIYFYRDIVSEVMSLVALIPQRGVPLHCQLDQDWEGCWLLRYYADTTWDRWGDFARTSEYIRVVAGGRRGGGEWGAHKVLGKWLKWSQILKTSIFRSKLLELFRRLWPGWIRFLMGLNEDRRCETARFCDLWHTKGWRRPRKNKIKGGVVWFKRPTLRVSRHLRFLLSASSCMAFCTRGLRISALASCGFRSCMHTYKYMG